MLTLFEEFLVTATHHVDSSDYSPTRSHLLRDCINWVFKRWVRENEMAF
jgi:hypothetical protein